VSTLLHATVYMFLHNLLNILVQIANKMGLQKDKLVLRLICLTFVCTSKAYMEKIKYSLIHCTEATF
jgi:hypothetical protein